MKFDIIWFKKLKGKEKNGSVYFYILNVFIVMKGFIMESFKS